MLYRFSRRGRRTRRRSLPELRVALLELPDLAGRAPAQVAVARIPEIGIRDRVEAALGIEPCGNFVGYGLVVNEAVFARRPDRFLVRMLSVQLATFEFERPPLLPGRICRRRSPDRHPPILSIVSGAGTTLQGRRCCPADDAIDGPQQRSVRGNSNNPPSG